MPLPSPFDLARPGLPARAMLAPPASTPELILINEKSVSPAEGPQTDFNQRRINP
jgi:hypothetical protein